MGGAEDEGIKEKKGDIGKYGWKKVERIGNKGIQTKGQRTINKND